MGNSFVPKNWEYHGNRFISKKELGGDKCDQEYRWGGGAKWDVAA